MDLQNDFLPFSDEEKKRGMGGALAVPRGDEIIPVVNGLLPLFDLVVFTQDWHPHGMDAFASSHPGKKPFDNYINKQGVKDTLWPDHCVQNTPGAMVNENVRYELINGQFYFFKKGTTKDYHPYSGFDRTGLAFFLREKNIDKVYVTGLALDYCVKATALDAVENNFETVVVKDATRAISPMVESDYYHLKKHGVNLVNSFEIPGYRALN